ncbi:MAG: hypothetical protein QG614_405 [Patescibacteria group bacterium]|nr:hypothetical protein [Patescibacteria group bacterium]
MRIAVIGPQNTGKTTFIKDFLKDFDRYKTIDKTYRDIVRDESLLINQDTTENSQQMIRDFMYETIKNNQDMDVIFDRCIIDNYVYTYLAYERGSIAKDFVITTKTLLKEHLKYLDALIFIPTAAGVQLVQDDQRDIDTDYIDDTNRVFLDTLFEIKDEFYIPIFVLTGNREKRIKTIKRYLS